MIFYHKNLETYKLKAKSYKLSNGMTYIELIVVLAIFAVISTAVMFNYGSFQDKVDIKNLASDIALQIVEAQKSSVNGVLPSRAITVDDWKPSYGVYFSKTTIPDGKGADNKNFIYFTDLDNQDGVFDGLSCVGNNTECLNKITITKNNYISELIVVYQNKSLGQPDNLTVAFKRPNSGALLSSGDEELTGVSYAQIIIKSAKGTTVSIRIYPSGRVQII